MARRAGIAAARMETARTTAATEARVAGSVEVTSKRRD